MNSPNLPAVQLFAFWLTNGRRLRSDSNSLALAAVGSELQKGPKGTQAGTRVRPVQPSRGLGVDTAQGKKQSGAWPKLCDPTGLLRQSAQMKDDIHTIQSLGIGLRVFLV